VSLSQKFFKNIYTVDWPNFFCKIAYLPFWELATVANTGSRGLTE
jgi:hypothetical protein